MNQTYKYHFSSAVGELLLMSNGDALSGLYFPGHAGTDQLSRDARDDRSRFRETCFQLSAYFAGELQTFDLPLHMTGTPFQKLVWQELLNIPFGTTISYSELA